jgi:hypothetical protein
MYARPDLHELGAAAELIHGDFGVWLEINLSCANQDPVFPCEVGDFIGYWSFWFECVII